MLVICSSVKGGSGTSVVAASLAVTALLVHPDSTSLIVDLAGDQPAVLGLPEPEHGLTDWMSHRSDLRFHDLVESHDRLGVVGRGRGHLPAAGHEMWGHLRDELLERSRRGDTVVVDVGRGMLPGDFDDHALRLLVVQPCYVALKRFVENRPDVDGTVVVCPPDRVLTVSDVATVTELPVLAQIPMHPDVARRVDAGLLRSRLPRIIHLPLAALLSKTTRS